MKHYKTRNFHRAAYLVYLGAKYITSEGSINDAVYMLEVPKEVFKLEEEKTLVNYINYEAIRQKMKEDFREERGLPRRYHKSKPFTFIDIAHN